MDDLVQLDVVKTEDDPLDCGDNDNVAAAEIEQMNQDGGACSESATQKSEPLEGSGSEKETDYNDANAIRTRGRTLCVVCGISLLRKRRYYLMESQSNEKKELIVKEIKEIAEQRSSNPINNLDCCCVACWSSATRAVERRMKEDLVSMDLAVPSDTPQTTDDHQHSSSPEISSITLPNYKRIPIRKPCFYYNCNSTAGRLVPRSLRLELLMEYNFYLPPRTLACEDHSYFQTWETLESLPNIKSTFRSEHIEDILSMLKNGISKKDPKIEA